ncbi:MAG: GyrI-like domain-containing protein [Clostridiales bacterium]|nr:GyrI-like domain-containing protein [Clostridiales bacterium]
MKTELTHLPAMLLGGVSFYGDPFSRKGGWDSENEIGKTCLRFADFVKQNPRRPYSCGKDVSYEVHVYGEETETRGYFEVFVGEEVNNAHLPAELLAKFLPESDYVKIELHGQEITSDWWQTLDTDILPAFHAKRNAAYSIQAYDNRFKGMEQLDASVIDVYIPVETA